VPVDSLLIRVGTAGWSIPRAVRDRFSGDGSHLELYAARFHVAEINSSFYRQHKRAVYAKWASAVPDTFRFSVKLPRAITHDQMLVASDVLMEVFLEEVTGLGDKLGALLVQLPASHAFDVERSSEFFTMVRAMYEGPVVCEPRHPSWFTLRVETFLREHHVTRAGADPACVSQAARSGGEPGFEYYRLHGSPRMYYSSYSAEALSSMSIILRNAAKEGRPAWCILDNTASGAAAADALALQRMVE
jgi:uncharacterized protein YecE (DUF72 family)